MQILSPIDRPRGITHAFDSGLNNHFLYYTSETVVFDQTVKRIDVNGAGLTTIITDAGTGNKWLTSDDNFIYVLRESSREVFRYNIDGTGKTTLLTLPFPNSFPQGIATDGTFLFISVASNGNIFRYNIDGTGETIIDNSLVTPIGVAVNGTHLFVSANGAANKDVFRFNKDGSGKTAVGITGVTSFGHVSLDDFFVYVNKDDPPDGIARTNLDLTSSTELYTNDSELANTQQITNIGGAVYAAAQLINPNGQITRVAVKKLS